MTVSLTTIAGALHRYGAAIDPAAMTKVKIEIQHIGSDLVAMRDSDWTYNISLLGNEGRPDSFTRSWAGIGSTDGEAVDGLHQAIMAELEGFYERRVSSARVVAETLQSLTLVDPAEAETGGSSENQMLDNLPPIEAYEGGEAELSLGTASYDSPPL